jgi:G:T/U-mismatch repair DNA glycosylase
LYSAWAGHHFARPGNRFWPALFASGFTDRLLTPDEEHELLQAGYGITNLVERATIGSDELTRKDWKSEAAFSKRKRSGTNHERSQFWASPLTESPSTALERKLAFKRNSWPELCFR